MHQLGRITVALLIVAGLLYFPISHWVDTWITGTPITSEGSVRSVPQLCISNAKPVKKIIKKKPVKHHSKKLIRKKLIRRTHRIPIKPPPEPLPPTTNEKARLFQSVFGNSVVQDITEDLVGLFINGEDIGEVTINALVGTKEFELSPHTLAGARITPEVMALLLKSIDPNSGHILSQKLKADGFGCQYLKGLGQIRLETPTNSKKKIFHPVKNGISPKRSGAYFSPAKISGAINVEGHQITDHILDQSSGELLVSTVVNIHSTVIKTRGRRAFLANMSTPPTALDWYIDQLQVSRRERTVGLDYSLGDVDPVAIDFLNVSNVWGARIGTIQESNRYQRIHFVSMSIRLDDTAIVEIYANKVQLDTFMLRSGEHQFDNIPLRDGISLVEIVVIDPKTRQIKATIQREFNFNSLIIEPGKLEYLAVLGVNDLWRQPSVISTKTMTGAGAYTLGIDDATMHSGTIQANGQTIVIGANSTHLIREGIIRPSIGLTARGNSASLGGRLDYYSLPNSLPFESQINISAEMYGNDFARASTAGGSRQLQHRLLGLLTTSPFLQSGVRLKVYFDLQQDTDNTLYNRFGTTVECPLSAGSRFVVDTTFETNKSPVINALFSIYQLNAWSFDVSVQHSNDDTSTSLGLKINLGNDVEFNSKLINTSQSTALSSLSYHTPENNFMIYGDYAQSARFKSYGVNSRQTVFGNVLSETMGYQTHPSGYYQAQSWAGSLVGPRAIANISYVDMPDSDKPIRSTALSGGTSVLFADGVMALSAPVQGSFAIINPSAMVANTPIVANKKIHSDGLGPVVVPTLLEDGESTIYVDAPEADMDVDLGRQSFIIYPNRSDGYVIYFGGAGTQTMTCSLVDKTGKIYKQRRIRVSAISSEEPFKDKIFLTDDDGVLEVVGMSAGDYELFAGNSKTCLIKLRITHKDSDTLDLGRIILKEEPITIVK